MGRSASMEPQVKSAENLNLSLFRALMLVRFNGAASKICGKLERGETATIRSLWLQWSRK